MTVVLLVVVAAAVAMAAVAVIALRRARQLPGQPSVPMPPDTTGRPEPGSEQPATPEPAETSDSGGSAPSIELARLEAVVMASLDAVVVVDVAGEVVLRNAAAEQYHDARHADALAEVALGELLEAARAGEQATRALDLFGPPRSVLEIRAVPLYDRDTVVGAVAFIRDVSDARRTEAIRRDFVANVSHELKTPIGALALLAETMASGDDAVVNQPLAERMVGEADRLTQIIDDLLDLSLIETQDAADREPVAAGALLSESIERVRAQAEAAETPLIEVGGEPELIVSCDRGQVVSAITNLLDNAVKYSDPGQEIECRVRREGDRAVISVCDHGIGIPARDLERIFERFYRVDRARSRVTGGTGLGLSIVRHVAQAHGGEVGVESTEGEGSTFTLTLRLE